MTIASTLPVALTTSVIGPRVTFSVVQACGAEPAQPAGEESARQSGRRSRTLCDGWFIAVLLPLPGANVKAGQGPQSLEPTDHGESRTRLARVARPDGLPRPDLFRERLEVLDVLAVVILLREVQGHALRHAGVDAPTTRRPPSPRGS